MLKVFFIIVTQNNKENNKYYYNAFSKENFAFVVFEKH